MNMTSVIEATINIQKAMEEDSKIGYFLTIYPDSCVAGLLYKGEPPPGDPFREFDSIEPKEILVPKSPATYCSSARALSMSTPMRYAVPFRSPQFCLDFNRLTLIVGVKLEQWRPE